MLLFGQMQRKAQGEREMNYKSAITILAVLALVFAATASLAGPGYRGGCPNNPSAGGGYGQGYAGNPQLTPEQQEKYAQLRQEHLKAMDAMRSDMFEKRSRLDALMSDPDASQAEIDSVVSQMNEIRNNMFEERVNYRMQVADETGIRPPMGRQGRGGYGQGYGPQQNCPGAQLGYGYGRGGGRGWGGCPGAGYERGYQRGPRW
jgi:zinc resistance-associated protein